MIVDETPGDEIQILPVVDLTDRHHELPVRNVASRNTIPLHFPGWLVVIVHTWGGDNV